MVRTLGSLDNSEVIYVSLELDEYRFSKREAQAALPTSVCRIVSNTPQDRIAVLSELGYEPYDFDLWDGWIILEESSAERIIRDYLIPWFVPRLSRVRLSRVRLLAANGVGKVSPTFEDFHRLFRFTHLEDLYHGRAWVIVDGDDGGKATIEKLKDQYKGWPGDHFLTWSEAAFERYYPTEFQDRCAEVLAISDRQAKREAKKALLEEVRQWLDADPARAKEALATSAAAVIEQLQAIEVTLSPHLGK